MSTQPDYILALDRAREILIELAHGRADQNTYVHMDGWLYEYAPEGELIIPFDQKQQARNEHYVELVGLLGKLLNPGKDYLQLAEMQKAFARGQELLP